MKKIIKRTLLSLLGLLVLAIAIIVITANRPRWIEWDEHDPKLHGQQVIFNQPMVYALFNERHKKTILKDLYELGGYVVASDLRIRDTENSFSYRPVPEGEVFTIVGSYWHRVNWWEQGFVNDSRRLVVENNQQQQKILFFGGLYDSNRKDLLAFEKDGY